MRVLFTKGQPGAACDNLTCIRPDTTDASTTLPRAGVLPALAIRYVVERTVAASDGVFSQIARGRTWDGTNAVIDTIIARQTAALAERLQAEQWGGGAPFPEFIARLAEACARREVPAPALSPEQHVALKDALRTFGAAWRPLAAGAVLERTFPDGTP